MPEQRPAGRKGSIWQRRIWERPILSLADLAEYRDLIECAPVHAGLVRHAEDGQCSKASQAALRGGGGNAPKLRVIDGGR
jgi:hypothetical protein|tara:strand:- start:664 stop:903 length:240 start_codon:yes stop_codon:yes gene_type:complete